MKIVITNQGTQSVAPFLAQVEAYLKGLDNQPTCFICEKPLEVKIEITQKETKETILASLVCEDISVCIGRWDDGVLSIPHPEINKLKNTIIAAGATFAFRQWREKIKLPLCSCGGHITLKLQGDKATYPYLRGQSILMACSQCRIMDWSFILEDEKFISLTQNYMEAVYRANIIIAAIHTIIAKNEEPEEEATQIINKLMILAKKYGFTKNSQRKMLWQELQPFSIGSFSTHEKKANIQRAFEHHFKC